MTKLWQLPRLQKMHVIQSNLARLDTSAEVEAAEITARKERERKDKLAEHDAMFGIFPGVTLGATPPDTIIQPQWTAGDEGNE